MKASILDLRRRMKDVLRALEHNEIVTVTHRGREKGVLCPARAGRRLAGRAAEHPAFGMWRNRADLKDVGGAVRRLRKARHAL